MECINTRLPNKSCIGTKGIDHVSGLLTRYIVHITRAICSERALGFYE